MTPTLSPQEVNNRPLHRRAIEAVIWGMPLVTFDRMCQGLTAAHRGWNQILYWSRPSTWKNQLLTPNPDAIYALPFFNTKSGERFEALFRFYGPEKSVFDKSWTLPDIEKAQ